MKLRPGCVVAEASREPDLFKQATDTNSFKSGAQLGSWFLFFLACVVAFTYVWKNGTENPGFGNSGHDLPVAIEAFGGCGESPCVVYLIDFHPDTKVYQDRQLKTLFGKGYSSDITGDGPKNSVDDALKQLSGVAPAHNNKNYSQAVKNGRNKKVDYQKPKSGGREDSDDMSERSEGRRVHPAKKREEEKAKEKKESDVVWIVRPREVPLTEYYGANRGWDGHQTFSFFLEAGLWKAAGQNDGVVLGVVQEGQMVKNVKSSQPGYVVTHSEAEKTVRAVAAFEWYAFDREFTLEGKIYDPVSFDVFVPFLNFLRTKVSTPAPTETHRNMAMASANRHYGGLLQNDVLVTTYAYYVHYNAYRLFRLQTGYGRIVVDDRDRVIDSEMVRYGEVKFDGEVGRHASIDCPVAQEYPFRPDCALVFSETDPGSKEKRNHFVCTQWNVGSEGRDYPDGKTYPQFVSSEPGANAMRYTRSIYTGFYPMDATPFVMYSVNALNAAKALKRMCGARDNLLFDRELTSLQYSAFAHIYFNDEVDWVGNREEVRFGKHWTWRSRFETVARIKFNKDPNGCKLYSEVAVGDPVQIEKLQKLSGDVPELRPVKYPCPVVLQPGLLWDSEYTDRGPMLDWFSKYTSLLRIYAQMRVGFSDLLRSFSRDTLDNYSASHPKWIYRTNYENFTTFLNYQESREELALIPHIKRALRHMFVQRVVEHTPDDNMTRFVEAKVKKEFAKQGKVPRLYVTYDGGCMYANELPEYAKVCLDGCRTYTHKGVKVHINIFAKPTSPGLTASLREAINCMSRHDEVYILIYSDDSVWAGNLNGVDFAFNVDISSCDSGNKAGVFGLIFMLLSQFSPELAIGLVSQCANVIKLQNPEDPLEMCEIHMFSLFEGSGTVLTTILNHVAMFMIAQAAVVILGDYRHLVNHWEKISDLVVKCGEAFGHVLTVEPARNDFGFVPEKIQFLKRSPLRLMSGEYVPVMNYGTIFRGFGSIEGDLTADMVGMSVVEFAQLSAGERMDVFLSGVVAGLKNEPNSIILSALRRRFCSLPGRLASGWDELDHVRFSLQSSNVLDEGSADHARGMVCTESLSRRYDVNTSQLDALAGKISNCRVGCIYPDECVGSFARVDYGCGRV